MSSLGRYLIGRASSQRIVISLPTAEYFADLLDKKLDEDLSRILNEAWSMALEDNRRNLRPSDIKSSLERIGWL